METTSAINLSGTHQIGNAIYNVKAISYDYRKRQYTLKCELVSVINPLQAHYNAIYTSISAVLSNPKITLALVLSAGLAGIIIGIVIGAMS